MRGLKIMPDELDPLHVIVKFGKGVPSSVQGPALLSFETVLRRLFRQQFPDDPNDWIEVFKEVKGDDSKLRALMTKEQRSKL